MLCVSHCCTLCGRWRELGLSRRACAWRVAGPGGQGQTPSTPPSAAQAPRPSWDLPQWLPAEATCSGRAWRESGALAICAGHGSCPRGHTASILIKLVCHADQISQRAPAAHILQGGTCLSSLGHVPQLHVGRTRLASPPEKAQVWWFHPPNPGRGGASASGVFMSSLCHEMGEDCERRQCDFERVPSMPSKFPANQAHACGPLRPGRQPSLRQEVSWHTGRPLFQVLPGSSCWLWP